MKICHVSFGRLKTGPHEWLASVPYFTKILTSLSGRHEVISFHYADQSTSVVYGNLTYRFLRASMFETFSVGRLLQEVNKAGPDVIIVHGFHSVWITYQFVRHFPAAAIYLQHHGEQCFRGGKRFLHKKTDQYVRGYFFSSIAEGREWVNAGLISNSDKVKELLEVTSSFSGKDRDQPREHPLSFLWVGRLDENKDPFTLVDGFITFLKAHPHATVDIFFKESQLLDDLKARIKGHEQNIRLRGFVPHAEMEAWFTKSDFIISTSQYEVAGVSVLEAMSCGCIPILTDIPAFQKISNKGTVGLLFQSQSSQALAAALERACHLDISKERAKVARHFDANLSASAVAAQVISLIGEKERSSPER